MTHTFFGLLSRMRLIRRWSLMRNLHPENVAEHSFEVAILAHALAHLRRERFATEGRVLPDPRRVMELAMFHDVPEVITGDLPTPVKYHNPELRQAFGEMEEAATRRLLQLLPPDLRPSYEVILTAEHQETEDPELRASLELVKAADKISAWLKCLLETQQGNTEFALAQQSILDTLQAMRLPEVDCFLAEFAPAYGLPLDTLQEEA